jgi:hypothetical protein
MQGELCVWREEARESASKGEREKLCVGSKMRGERERSYDTSKAATRATEAETQTRIACVCLVCIALLQLCCNFCVFLVCALRVSKQCASVSPLLLL